MRTMTSAPAEIERRKGLRHRVARQFLVARSDRILKVEDEPSAPRSAALAIIARSPGT